MMYDFNHMNRAPVYKQTQKLPVRVYLATFVVVFFSALSAADSIDFVPNYIDGSTSLTTSGTAPIAETTPADSVRLADLPQLGQTQKVQGVLPTHIKIPAIGLDLSVQNPSTLDVNALDALLQKGPARYADSAELGVAGTMIIFAHSSHLPIVHNKMFRAFNKIPELKAGDSIALDGGGKEYVYSVVSVTKADAMDTNIDISPSEGTRLVLVTCDTLTGKSARYVLTASFVGAVDI
jgi:LPXTG-site transpeptidase (sortase) family protein